MSNLSDRSKEETPGIRAMKLVKRFIYWIAMLLVVASACFYYREPIPLPLERIVQIQKLQAQKDALASKSAQLSRRVEWLKDANDPGYLVIEARDKLGMQRDDEVIVRLE
jgi:cell division protein FtsB